MIPKKINIDWSMFYLVFTSDDNDINPDGFPCLDKLTGDSYWIYDDDREAEFYGFNPAENAYNRKQFEKYPKRFLLIEGRTYRCDDQLLSEFLESYSIANKEFKKAVKECCKNSINGWKQNIRINRKLGIEPKIVVKKWRQFVDDKIEKDMEKFLRENKINFEWR